MVARRDGAPRGIAHPTSPPVHREVVSLRAKVWGKNRETLSDSRTRVSRSLDSSHCADTLGSAGDRRVLQRPAASGAIRGFYRLGCPDRTGPLQGDAMSTDVRSDAGPLARTPIENTIDWQLVLALEGISTCAGRLAALEGEVHRSQLNLYLNLARRNCADAESLLGENAGWVMNKADAAIEARWTVAVLGEVRQAVQLVTAFELSVLGNNEHQEELQNQLAACAREVSSRFAQLRDCYTLGMAEHRHAITRPHFHMTTDLLATSDRLWLKLRELRSTAMSHERTKIRQWQRLFWDVADLASEASLRPEYGDHKSIWQVLAQYDLDFPEGAGGWDTLHDPDDTIMLIHDHTCHTQLELCRGVYAERDRLAVIEWAEVWMNARERQLLRMANANAGSIQYDPAGIAAAVHQTLRPDILKVVDAVDQVAYKAESVGDSVVAAADKIKRAIEENVATSRVGEMPDLASCAAQGPTFVSEPWDDDLVAAFAIEGVTQQQIATIMQSKWPEIKWRQARISEHRQRLETMGRLLTPAPNRVTVARTFDPAKADLGKRADGRSAHLRAKASQLERDNSK